MATRYKILTTKDVASASVLGGVKIGDRLTMTVDTLSADVQSGSEKVKFDSGDPTSGFLNDKIIAGTGISVAEGTGADENKLVISETDPALHLDQTTPQTIINGKPIFQSGLDGDLYSGAVKAFDVSSRQIDDTTGMIALAGDSRSLNDTTGGVALSWSDGIEIYSEYTLPKVDGTDGQVLTTDGAGVVAWEDGGGGGGSLAPYATYSTTTDSVAFGEYVDISPAFTSGNDEAMIIGVEIEPAEEIEDFQFVIYGETGRTTKQYELDTRGTSYVAGSSVKDPITGLLPVGYIISDGNFYIRVYNHSADTNSAFNISIKYKGL